MRLAPIIATAALAALAPCAFGAEATLGQSAFDRPLAVKHVDLGAAETVPPQRKEVRCSYFDKFMVKEVDEREVGAAQLSILPATPARRPHCQRANLPDEHVLSGTAWSGYFAGAHGDLAFFRADDGLHGGLGFAVVRPPDATVLYSAVADGKLQFSAGVEGATVLRFAAIHGGDCSVAVNGAACAASIARQAGVATFDVGLCLRGYAAAKRLGALDWCKENAPKDAGCVDKQMTKMTDWDASPSVIGYPVEVVLGPAGAAAHPTGAPAACWPAE